MTAETNRGNGERTLSEGLRNQMLKELSQQKGHVGFFYRNLVTGEELGYHEDDRFPAASVIKLPLFMAVSKWDAEGTASMTEPIRVREQDKVPICGALTLFTGEPVVDVRTLCNLMISLSDNTATNVLVRRYGIPAFRKEFQRMGLEGTALNRCLFDEEASGRGEENYIVPTEIASLLEEVYRHAFVSEEVSETVKDTLLLQQIHHKMGGILGDQVDIAHKTGEDEELTHDVGIVYGKQPFIACFAGDHTDVPAFEDWIRRTTAELYQACEA